LEEAGYCVKTATGGREALNKLHDEAGDLVVLDLELPDGKGLDYLQDIVVFNLLHTGRT
jgi:DNA-binding response OmpR family regulator